MKSLLNQCCLLLCLYLSLCSFQTNLFKEMNKQFVNDNLIISPLSAYQVLGLATNGAKGKTLQQMLLALGNKNLDELNKINIDILKVAKQFSTVEIANAIMTKFNPEKKFLLAGSKYGATVEALKSASQVNSWCNSKTHGKIKKIIDKLDDLTQMILLNAVYFKGEWYKGFIKSKTLKKPFYNLNNKSNEKKVDRMSKIEFFKYFQNNELQIVELPYKKDSMSAVIILPNEKKNINNFISELTDEKLQDLLKKMTSKKVNLELPKFELHFSSGLNSFLKKIGMSEPFNEYSADFSEMKKEKDIHIDSIIQKTYLKVDEKGTEAAAVTAIRHNLPQVKKIEIPVIYPMIINRPFIFMLRNKKMPKNYEMLFMSKIEKL